MKPLMPPIDTPDKLFHDGNPATGAEGTIVPAEHLNNEQASIRDLQSEMIAILTAAAMAPDSTAGQLLAALNKLYAPGNDTLGALASLVGAANKLPYFTGPKGATLTDLTKVGRDIIGQTDIAAVLQYLGLEVTSGPTYLTAKIGAFIVMVGNCSKYTTPEGNLNIMFPFAFPDTVFYLNITQANASYAADTDPLIFSPYPSGPGPVTALGAAVRNSKTGASQPNKFVNARYIAAGKA
ncbi:hypothetical protein [Citrobacter braakii]|uniref:hypothetical protein n=1 Tax=Citrobacter braakii TaxID=57706 RepID=UPI0030762CAD